MIEPNRDIIHAKLNIILTRLARVDAEIQELMAKKEWLKAEEKALREDETRPALVE